MLSTTLIPLLVAPIVSAHFHIDWPVQRDAVEMQQATYPCSNANTPSSNRTELPIGSPFPIQLDLEHTSSNIQVLLAISQNPDGNSFTHVLRPTLAERGPRDFCVGGVVVPSSLVTPGTNATIMVATNGEGGGGLYNCADVTFTNMTLSQDQYRSHCNNATGVSVTQAMTGTNANGTTQLAGASPSSGSGSATTPSSAASGLVVPGAEWKGATAVVGTVIVGLAAGLGLML